MAEAGEAVVGATGAEGGGRLGAELVSGFMVRVPLLKYSYPIKKKLHVRYQKN